MRAKQNNAEAVPTHTLERYDQVHIPTKPRSQRHRSRSSKPASALDASRDDRALLTAHLADLVDRRGSIRCWVPACGTGEAAYSLALLLAEIVGRQAYGRLFKIFGTDIAADKLVKARAGQFCRVTPKERPEADRHLVGDRQPATIDSAIRDGMVFAEHDLLRDPPISKLDLIRCDHVFSDFDHGDKKRLIALFQYILNPGGYLWLGRFEPVDGLDVSFEAMDERSPLLRRRDSPKMLTSDLFGFCNQPHRHDAHPRKPPDRQNQLECNVEELMTLNEELQVANEETTATNEELNILNQELQARSDQLNNALDRLEASEARYRSVVEDQSELICRYRPDGTITFVNTAFCTFAGVSRREILGNNFGDMCPVDDDFSSRLERLTSEQPVQSLDCQTTLTGGRTSWQHWSDRALFDDKGEVVEYQSVGQDITARIDAEQRYRYLAGHDQLTGLANRHGFFESLRSSLALAKRTSQKIAIHYLDLDHFKAINDALGHKVGDGLLQSVGLRLVEVVRSHDIVARLGGDEFAVVQTSTRDASDVAALASRILAAVQAEHDVDDHQIRTSTTIGIAMFPEDGSDAEALLDKADLAMYESKKLGGSRYGFFTHSLNEQVAVRYRLQTDLLSAIDAKQFRVHFQPLVNLQSQRVEAVEALLRWQHPTLGLLTAAEFIDVLESSAEMVSISEWVLEEACREAKSWLDNTAYDLRLNVNLSATMLRQPELVKTTERILDRIGFDPAKLELEITEHAVINVGLEEAAAKLDQLRDLGISVALDDFGTGYSSLTFLRSLPVSHLKIDRSFVAGLNTSAEDKAIVDAVIDLGKNLSLRVTAEGVEDQEVSTYLRTRGCDEAQGYLFGAAMTADAITALIGENAELRECFA